MNIREISKPMTAKSLNESLAARFGKKINLEAFTIEQLEDARNKLRTKLSQFETNESFDTLHSNETYQKNKLFLDVLNAAVSEADWTKGWKDQNLVTKKKKGPDGYYEPDGYYDGADKAIDKKMNKDVPIKTAVNYAEKKKKAAAAKNEDKMPDKNKDGIPDYAQDGKGKNDLGKDAKPKEKKAKDLSKVPPQLRKHMKKDEGKEIINNYFQTLVEGEEDKAEIVMAAKDMVDRITGWMEDTAEMQSESMLELGDAIRDEMGEAQSQSFIQTVKPALESLYTALESTRGSLTGGVGQLTGEAEPAQDMGAEEPEGMATDDAAPEAEMEPTVDAEGGDDFGASEPAAGGEDEAGRDKRESIIQKRKMIETSRRLGTILSKKK